MKHETGTTGCVRLIFIDAIRADQIRDAITRGAANRCREQMSFLRGALNGILTLVDNNENERACKKLASLIELL